MLTSEEIKEKLEVLEQIVGNQKLSGVDPDPQVIENLKKVARGEQSMDDVLKSFLQRIKNEQGSSS